MKKIISLILVFSALMLCFASCGNEATTTTAKDTAPAGNVTGNGNETSSAEILSGDDPTDYDTTVNIEMSVKDFGVIKLELYPSIAPETVENFKTLAESGFYDGLTFHRIMSGFMIQGGDPDGNGTGGSDKTIKGEFLANNFNNPISHKRGVISMARSNLSYDSASSQFFICHADSEFLDGNYAAFGKVTEGLDVVDKIASVEVKPDARNEMSVPVNPVIIDYVKVVD